MSALGGPAGSMNAPDGIVLRVTETRKPTPRQGVQACGGFFLGSEKTLQTSNLTNMVVLLGVVVTKILLFRLCVLGSGFESPMWVQIEHPKREWIAQGRDGNGPDSEERVVA